jgi:hypothetical protein
MVKRTAATKALKPTATKTPKRTARTAKEAYVTQRQEREYHDYISDSVEEARLCLNEEDDLELAILIRLNNDQAKAQFEEQLLPVQVDATVAQLEELHALHEQQQLEFIRDLHEFRSGSRVAAHRCDTAPLHTDTVPVHNARNATAPARASRASRASSAGVPRVTGFELFLQDKSAANAWSDDTHDFYSTCVGLWHDLPKSSQAKFERIALLK